MLNKKELLISTVMICATLTGCNGLKQDHNPAIASIKTSSGLAVVESSYNGAGRTWTGETRALFYSTDLLLKEGVTVWVEFECDACGNLQKWEIKSPFAKLIHCDCPEKIDKEGNSREFFALSISYDNTK